MSSIKINELPQKTQDEYAVYKFVVHNWAVQIPEVAESLSLDKPQVRNTLRRLETKNLVSSQHVNGETSTTWQSNFDFLNEEGVEELSDKAFAEAYGIELDEPQEAPKGHGKGGGRRYTDETLAKGVELRETGMPWSKVAIEAAGTHAAYHFSMAVRDFHGSDPSPEGSSRESKGSHTVRLNDATLNMLAGALQAYEPEEGPEDDLRVALLDRLGFQDR